MMNVAHTKAAFNTKPVICRWQSMKFCEIGSRLEQVANKEFTIVLLEKVSIEVSSNLDSDSQRLRLCENSHNVDMSLSVLLSDLDYSDIANDFVNIHNGRLMSKMGK